MVEAMDLTNSTQTLSIALDRRVKGARNVHASDSSDHKAQTGCGSDGHCRLGRATARVVCRISDFFVLGRRCV